MLEACSRSSDGPKLEEAAVVVSGGRGIGAAENYKPLVEELAKVLKGASGASRAIVDAGWVPYAHAGRSDRQDREAEGVHRARHLGRHPAHGRHEGLRQHHRVNKDGEAPIFGIADLGIVGDVHKVVPKLIEAIKSK